jgi:hypothetical protein
LEGIVQRRRSFQPDLALRECPGREMHVRIVEPRQHTAAAEIDPVRACERRLMRPDAAGYAIAGNGERAGDWERGLHRPHDPVLEDQGRNLLTGSAV